ncbi:MAG TPA: phosphotransferase family protein [Vicinamibacterales bacterium]|nr:phosphotransferase family protein [Vicinamibacterales bacterium]
MIVYARVSDDTRDIRAGESLDWETLGRYLRGRLRTARELVGLDVSAPLRVSQFPGGHSNLTYLIQFGSAELVLRRPPLGTVPPKAHDMRREFTWLQAIHPVYPLAPEPYLLCEDPDVIGAPFYVMERRRGLVVGHEEPKEIAGNKTARLRVSQAIVDALAELHSIDARSPAFAPLGKPSGFVARQVAGWTERWERSKTSDVPELDAIAVWLRARIPADAARPAIVHGDFKLDNVMIDPLDVGRLAAVFDWEMCALGDPMIDVGIVLAYWTAAPGDDALGTVTRGQGWFSREEIIARYMLRSGRDVGSIRFYEAFARFKIAVVIQQIYYRYVNGQTRDERFAAFGDRVTALARQAVQIAGD